jgi:hypothetical protein
VVPARASQTQDPRIGADYANGALAGKFERLPRCAAGKWCVGVRAILENSTACQKSMPSLMLGLLRWPSFLGVVVVDSGFFFG